MTPRLPTVSVRDMLAALKRAGFVEDSQKGSHKYLRRLSDGRTTAVPVHPGDLNRALVRAILAQAGITEDEFRKLL